MHTPSTAMAETQPFAYIAGKLTGYNRDNQRRISFPAELTSYSQMRGGGGGGGGAAVSQQVTYYNDAGEWPHSGVGPMGCCA